MKTKIFYSVETTQENRNCQPICLALVADTTEIIYESLPLLDVTTDDTFSSEDYIVGEMPENILSDLKEILENSEDLDGEIVDMVNKHFWDLI